MRGTRPDEAVLRKRLKGGASALRLSMAACAAQTGKLCDLALSRPGPRIARNGETCDRDRESPFEPRCKDGFAT
jgi:hypothetical protein